MQNYETLKQEIFRLWDILDSYESGGIYKCLNEEELNTAILTENVEIAKFIIEELRRFIARKILYQGLLSERSLNSAYMDEFLEHSRGITGF